MKENVYKFEVEAFCAYCGEKFYPYLFARVDEMPPEHKEEHGIECPKCGGKYNLATQKKGDKYNFALSAFWQKSADSPDEKWLYDTEKVGDEAWEICKEKK